ncbi:MAG: hypothetical protein ACKVJG_27755 [Candidatus Latescibacterota bacterium]|jgi:ankyrin repeat protein
MDIQPFFAAIATGDLETVRRQLDVSPFLAHVHNLNEEAWDEGSPLHSAAKHGHLAIPKLLVECGGEVYSHPHASYPAVLMIEGILGAAIKERDSASRKATSADPRTHKASGHFG